MTKPLSTALFECKSPSKPEIAWERCTARDLGLKESWFRDAIFANPELIIGPCRAAGVTEDDWYPWAREFHVDVGPIDMLLLSSQGRVAIVETKLAHNPELRRSVLAQALDYLTHLPESLDDLLSDIPKDENGEPVADEEDIRQSVAQGDILVVIVSDDVDPRVAKLSQTLIGDNLVKEWDLVLVDLALFKESRDSTGRFIIVPHVRNLVRSDLRQVVRVIVEGETPHRVEVDRFIPEPDKSGRQKWDEQKFFESLIKNDAPPAVQELASKLRELAAHYPGSVSLGWGTGRYGTVVLKRNNQGLIEIRGRGHIRFRPNKFRGALGKEVAKDYLRALETLVPRAMKMAYPRVGISDAARVAPKLFDVIKEILADPRLREA